MKRLLRVIGAATIIAQFVLAPGFAKEFLDLVKDQSNTSPTTVLLPGAITGIGSHAPTGHWRLCEPLSIGLNEWRVGFIEQLFAPNDAQKELLKRLLTASSEAKNAIESACSKESIASGPAHLTAADWPSQRAQGHPRPLRCILPIAR
jgi:hypothetical protein